MKLSRREFMALAGGSTAGAVIFTACGVPERELFVEAPLDIPEDLVEGRESWYATVASDNGEGLGLVVRVMEGRAKKVAGNPDYPVNLGKQAAHSDTALQELYHPDRLRTPMLRRSKGSAAVPISWAEAEAHLSQWISESEGRLTVATSPVRGGDAQILQQFVDAHSGRLIFFDTFEQGVLHQAVRDVFGQDRLPEFDIANAHTVLSFGADWLGTWISPVRYGVKYGEFRQGHEYRGFMIHAESRLSLTAASADRWLPVSPGRDGELALSIAHVIVNEGLVPEANIQAFTANMPDGALDQYEPGAVASRAGVAAGKIREAAHRFAEETPSIALGGGLAAAHTNGLFNLRAIYALNILSGSVGVEGGIWFNPEAPAGLPSTATGAPFQQWEEEIAQWRAGNVNTVITRGIDPAHGLPRSVNVPQALENVPHVVQFVRVLNETSEHADLILPEDSSLEEWGTDVPEPGPGYPVVGFRQPVVNAPLDRDSGKRLYDSRAFLDTLIQVSGRMEITSARDHAEQTAQALFERGGGSVNAPTEDLFLNGVLQRGGWWDTQARAATQAPSELTSPAFRREDPGFSDTEANVEGEEFHLLPFAHQALLDGRNAAHPWALATPDPITSVTWTTWAEINKTRAEELGIREGQWLSIRSTTGEIRVRAYPHPAVAPNVIAVPAGLGFSEGTRGRYAEGRGDNVLKILADLKDQDTGALAWGATRVKVSKDGGRQTLAKMEGTANEAGWPVEPGVPILLVRPGESAEAAKERDHHHHLEEISEL